jgi:hypothetical protein
VYLNDRLLGYTPTASFPIRNLDPRSNYVVAVKTVAEDGRESPREVTLKFSPAALTPAELSLTQLEPLRSTGRWRGFEADERLAGAPLSLGGKHYEQGLSAFANSDIEYDLHGLYDRFTVETGLDDASTNSATAEFVVLGDGKELWRSGELKKSDSSQPVEINIAGIHKLTLRTTSAGGRRNRAQVDWAVPSVSKLNQ